MDSGVRQKCAVGRAWTWRWRLSRRSVAAIPHLLGACRPSHIAWFIATIVVDAINRVLWSRSPADVGEKRCVRQTPFLTHRDPAPAVVRVGGMARIEAPSLHADPTSVFRRWRCAVNAFAVRTSVDFAHLASATLLRLWFRQETRSQNAFFAAVASTEPHGIKGTLHRNARNDSQTSRTSAAQVMCMPCHGVRHFTLGQT